MKTGFLVPVQNAHERVDIVRIYLSIRLRV
jgi:hypothetical protein